MKAHFVAKPFWFSDMLCESVVEPGWLDLENGSDDYRGSPDIESLRYEDFHVMDFRNYLKTCMEPARAPGLDPLDVIQYPLPPLNIICAENHTIRHETQHLIEMCAGVRFSKGSNPGTKPMLLNLDCSCYYPFMGAEAALAREGDGYAVARAGAPGGAERLLHQLVRGRDGGGAAVALYKLDP
ncbi:hypothetical protein FIBSPDRAFT_947715 [Athelia psychrophila]|uniref:Uncharacterized protein n=1 Tax=Athelia psychrophila TaxID=1759441 RepID=A0A166RNX1_9AGAM|nr:hypothetical protein FIBSPDRAFT_947715 [Fibularhizoctonia sp. CBS 109695]